uniref:Late blight resistance protein homolog R1B-12 isoform X1 n=2 Tax=Nicotiana sylvestris TaxID=4096 RepID=A0A1U7VES6_NICSY|nr:PREDICTED: putative late blight resistance protein homolog R1B-12 isoform X1 [Nicotiana sylvestris]XP_009763428.1 PREDICTED: putative late blight resistance protein homolog R1B-12 isoform X1 [Nicotiana sylvestris]XP_009763437.1 PREDICTED: putative late blight resistance protein homolog R1B-12 isoform X1 [Nicotiana sylvestris]
MEKGKQIDGEREKGELANNFEVKGNRVSYDQADSILVEPWGGAGGSEWYYKLKSPIKEILIAHGDCIKSIMFKTVTEQGTTIDSPKFGGDGGRRDKVVMEETPLEYLTCIKGTFGYCGGYSVVKSLCFITNAKNYGPFGCEAGTPFSLVMKEGGAIVGFHGRCGAYLDAIGVYLQKLTPPTLSKEPEAKNIEPNEPVVEEIEIHDGNQVSYDQADSILVEPWGGTGGSEWNYKLKSPIKEILIAHGGCIDSIMFKTITEQGTTIDSPKFGGNGGRINKVVFEETPLEHLTGIKGTLGCFDGYSVIKSLCFTTNVKNYGPFGSEGGGTPFSLVMKEGVAIVGFHGRCGAYLDAIGVYLLKYTPPASAQELEDETIEPNEPMVEEIIEIYYGSGSSDHKKGKITKSESKLPTMGNQVSYDQVGSILVGPWGGTGGSEWNYKLKSYIKEILIAHGGCIDSIMFKTITEQGTTIDSPKFGGNGGRINKVVIEATPLEYLTGIKGTFGCYNGHCVIKSLCFITNANNYGPFGSDAGGTPFSLVMKEGVAIVGFHGLCGAYLDAIGIYLQKLTPSTSAKEPMVEDIEIREVSLSSLRKDIVNILDFIESLKNEENQKAVDVDLIKKLKLKLAFFCTYVQLSYSNMENFNYIMTRRRQEVETILYDFGYYMQFKQGMHHIHPRLVENMEYCIGSCYLAKSSASMTGEQLDFLLQNLPHLSMYWAEQLSPFVTEYEILQNVCANIRDFHGLIVNGCVGHEIVEHVLPQFQLMAQRVGRFHWDDQFPGDSRLFKLAHLLLKIIPIELEVMHICFTNLKASKSAEVGRFIEQLLQTSPDILRAYLIHLQEHMVNVITASTPGARNIHIMIEFLLIILTDVPKDFIHNGQLFEFLVCVGALTRDVSAIARDLKVKSKNAESTNKTNSATLGLLENIELLKRELKDVYLKAPDSSQLCFPLSDAPLFMHLLLRHLNDLLNSNAYLVALIKEEIRLVKDDLEFIRSFFGIVEQKLFKDLWACVLDVAYETKDIIDSIIGRENGLLHLIFSLPLAIEKINLIKERVSNLFEKIPKNMGVIVVNSPNKPVERKSSIAGKIIVGFKEETYLIIRKLTSGPKTLDVISITGMPGSGKTTLAYKVYNDKSVYGHFDIRAWCTVDQKYDEIELLKKLFNQVVGSSSKFGKNIDVANELRKHLFGKRYLIVLDDLWDNAAWEELTRPFPEVENGSRIILTTREKKVAMDAQRHSDPLDLRLLTQEESWELLEKKVFGKESCPDELLDVGEEIVQNCKRLPLVVDLIAGVIAGKEKKRSVWLEVRNNMNSFIFQKEEDVMRVIALSYDNLPDPLKSCLIHLASFPKDEVIPVRNLEILWPAEGFLEQRDMKSVEEVVGIYLDNLISSSLVNSFNIIGDDRTCQIHDLVHQFCLIKAREEKLFDLISSSAPSSSSSDLMPRQMNIAYREWHFWHNNMHSGKHLYSLRITGHKFGDNSLNDICHLRHLRLLRVLQLDDSFILVNDSLLNEICTLVHLRYLNIRTKVKSLSPFSNLLNLETLWVNKYGPPLVLLPTIWNLVKLRVLAIYNCSFFDLDKNEPILVAEDSKSESMRLLRGLEVSYSKDTEDIFKRFPNLHELRFDLKESWDCSTGRYWFPKLDFLNELESLEVTFISSNSIDSALSIATNRLWDFHFPSSVKMLCLREFPLTSDSLSTIGILSNLEELYLKDAIIEGEEWNMGEEDTFQNLKCLTLQRVNLAKWEVREESFPALEKLRLRDCRKLEEIPPSFGDICSLKSIELKWSPQLEESALKIKQDVEDTMGEDRIQVLVHKS